MVPIPGPHDVNQEAAEGLHTVPVDVEEILRPVGYREALGLHRYGHGKRERERENTDRGERREKRAEKTEEGTRREKRAERREGRQKREERRAQREETREKSHEAHTCACWKKSYTRPRRSIPRHQASPV